MNNINVLLAPNSFKECASSVEISNYIEKSFSKILTNEQLKRITFVKRPISDGGDDFLEICTANLDLDLLSYRISTPYDDSKFECKVGYSRKQKKIFIESAAVLGLKLIPKEKRKPLKLSSKGMGELLYQIKSDVENSKLDVKEIVIGIGGTGTNDLALGTCGIFGMNLLDDAGNSMRAIPENFTKTKKVEWQNPDLSFKLTCVIDVDNVLLGENGATRIFGPQKGATPGDVEILEKGFENILQLTGHDADAKFISGAGGGLAAGLNLFFDAEYKFSYDFVKTDLGVSASVNYDLVITGEGSFDKQSLMNKGTMIVVNEFGNKDVPIYVLCGVMHGELKFDENVKIIELSKYFSSKEESMAKIEEGIAKACMKITEEFKF